MTVEVKRSGSPESPDIARLERAKVATHVVFATTGWAFATWAGRIPATRDFLDVTPGQLGLVLLVGSIGSLLGLPLAGRIANRFGAATTVRFGAVLLLGGLIAMGPVIVYTHSALLAALVLFVMTFGMGQWDVAMNLHGAEVERLLGRSIMPHFHAFFSLGTVVSALVAAGVAKLGVSIVVHFAVSAVVLFAITLYALRHFVSHVAPAEVVPEGAEVTAPVKKSAWTEPRVLLIGIVVLVSAFTEGTANDWIALAFVDGHHVPEWGGILGLATFLTFMTVGRISGTVMLDRYGRVFVLRVTFVLAAIGSLLLVFGNTTLAFVGAAIWGVGASLGFPVGMSAAADDPQRAAARVSVVATIGYLAFLLGPPVLGFLGDHWGILRALSVVSVMVILTYFVLPVTRKQEPTSV